MFEDTTPNADSDAQFVQDVSRNREFSKEGMTLFIAGMSYARKGGTLSEFQRIIARLLVEANLNDDAETVLAVPKKAAHGVSPASSPKANGSGPTVHAQTRPAEPAPPVREPSAGYKAAALAGAKQIAKTIFDTFKLRDGRAIGDVRYGELARLELSGLVEAEVVRAIRKRGIAPHDAQVRHIIKPAVLDRIITKAKEKCHAQ